MHSVVSKSMYTSLLHFKIALVTATICSLEFQTAQLFKNGEVVIPKLLHITWLQSEPSSEVALFSLV